MVRFIYYRIQHHKTSDGGGGGSKEGRPQTQTLVTHLKSSAFLLVPNRAGAERVSGPLLSEDLCLCPAQSRPWLHFTWEFLGCPCGWEHKACGGKKKTARSLIWIVSMGHLARARCVPNWASDSEQDEVSAVVVLSARQTREVTDAKLSRLGHVCPWQTRLSECVGV